MMPLEEIDLSFADFAGQQAGHVLGTGAVSSDPKRPPSRARPQTQKSPPA